MPWPLIRGLDVQQQRRIAPSVTSKPNPFHAVLVIGAIALAGFALHALYGTKAIDTSSSGAGLEARVAGIEQQQQEILQLLRAQGSDGGSSSATVRDGDGSDDSAPVAEENPTDEERQGAAKFAQFAAAHAREQLDTTWAPVTERKLATAMQSFAFTGVKPADLTMGCRSQSCSVVARFASRGDAEDWSAMFVTEAAPALAQARDMIVPMPDGTFELRVLGTRR